MKTLLTTVQILILTAIYTFASPPYEPYSPQAPQQITLKSGQKVTIMGIRVGTNSSQERALYIDYEPSSPTKNMWDHVIEMYDVAQHYHSLAPLQNVSKIWVTPLLNSKELFSSQNVSYPYTIQDGVASSDWKIEFQGWFRENKTDG